MKLRAQLTAGEVTLLVVEGHVGGYTIEAPFGRNNSLVRLLGDALKEACDRTHDVKGGETCKQTVKVYVYDNEKGDLELVAEVTFSILSNAYSFDNVEDEQAPPATQARVEAPPMTTSTSFELQKAKEVVHTFLDHNDGSSAYPTHEELEAISELLNTLEEPKP
jgi:hypothetical protein